MEPEEEFDYFFKIILLGDSGVGKSSLYRQITRGVFENTFTTTDLEYFDFKCEIDGLIIRICFWDTAGQEKFRYMTSNLYRRAEGVILTYDITNQTSFENIKTSWWTELARFAPPSITHLLVGNKCDLNNLRTISTQAGQDLANELKMQFIETSAKTDINVKFALSTLVRDIIQKNFTQRSCIDCDRFPEPPIGTTHSSCFFKKKKKNHPNNQTTITQPKVISN